MAKKIEISRIQNRRGFRRDLPQPLNPGELGMCIDTAQIYMGASTNNVINGPIAGLELYRPSPTGGQSEANRLKDRVLICDTVPLVYNTLDFNELTDAILGQGNYIPVFEGGNIVSGGGAYNWRPHELDKEYVMSYGGGSDIRNTIRYLDLGPEQNDDKKRRFRVFIGIYTQDFADPVPNSIYITSDDYPSGVPPVPDDQTIPYQEVRTNLLRVKFGGDYLFNNVTDPIEDGTLPDHAMVPAGGFFADGEYRNGDYNGVNGLQTLTVDEYGHIGWCINRIYSLGSSGLVVSTTNIELLTDIGFEEIVNPELSLISASATISKGISDLDSQDFYLDLGTDRAYKMDYTLSINTTDTGNDYAVSEEDVAMGMIDISVFIDSKIPSNSRLTFNEEQQFIPNSKFNTTDTHVRLLPYISENSEAKGQYLIRFQTINQTERDVRLKVNGIQWKAF